MKADEKIYDAVVKFITDSRLEITEKKEETYCDRLDVKSDIFRCNVNVFNSGKINVGGADSPLKQALLEMKKEVESGNFLPKQTLPFEIERFPELIQERIPECDPVTVAFIREAKDALKANLLLSSAFLLGAASEKATYLLVDAYAEAIRDEKYRRAFKERSSKSKAISKKFEEFMQSYKSCQTRPKDQRLLQDSDTVLTSMFTFYRLSRNEVGHPEIVPNLAKGVVLANMGQFIHYLDTVYGLIAFFKENPVVI
jgi:hypothetical protein